MLEFFKFFIENTFIMFRWRGFQQTVDSPVSTSCASFLSDLFLYSFEAARDHAGASKEKLKEVSCYPYSACEHCVTSNLFKEYLK